MGYVETHRLRVMNREQGAIQVSTDGGASWRLIGRVLAPANTAAEGYLAVNYADPGTVAATAVHGIRIRVSRPDPSLHAPLTISLDPREYAGKAPNKGYGGHRPGSSGIFTDIPAGTSLFRELAPLVGNPVFLENVTGRLVPLPDGFRPSGRGEVFVIPVRVPANQLSGVVFENRGGGAVTATFADGTSRRVTSVVQPVQGVGRFDGTAYTGVGRLNTAHSGVITVSTAPVDGALPEGEGRERRGGFQIEPAWHNARTEEAGIPQVMALGTPGPRKKELEGTAPLFRDAVPMAWGDDPKSGGIVDVQIDGADWEPMPAVVGNVPDAFTAAGLNRLWKAQGVKRTATKGVTALRLRLPTLSAERSVAVADAAADAYKTVCLARAKRGDMPIVNGLLAINANPTNRANVAYVRFNVEGVPRGFSNVVPFTLTWDTTRYPDGEYLVEAEALDAGGGVIASTRRKVFVDNETGGKRAATAR
jgi:hypothetical protein